MNAAWYWWVAFAAAFAFGCWGIWRNHIRPLMRTLDKAADDLRQVGEQGAKILDAKERHTP